MELSIQDDLWWGTRLRLRSWAGYQSRLGAYGAVDKPTPSDGTACLTFAPEGRGLEPLSHREQGLLDWFERNESDVSAAVKAAMIDWCSPRPSERLNRFDPDEGFPTILAEEDLKRHIGLVSVHVHQLDVEGVPYVGYEFGCDWAEEHGLGVLTHGVRVVEIGSADTAILLWIAERDAEQSR